MTAMETAKALLNIEGLEFVTRLEILEANCRALIMGYCRLDEARYNNMSDIAKQSLEFAIAQTMVHYWNTGVTIGLTKSNDGFSSKEMVQDLPEGVKSILAPYVRRLYVR